MIHNHSHIKTFTIVVALLVGLSLYAQDSIPDYEFVTNTNAWLSSSNAAGLSYFTGKKMSMASINTNKSDGDFINYYESDNSYSYGISTESYQKLTKKLTVYGKVNYAYFSGKNMGGSSFIDPYYNAFDIVEYEDSTAGGKVKESYSIAGGFSAQLSEQVYLGFKGDYKNVSYFKTKDLRHTNDLLNLNLHTGLMYKADHLDLGLSYSYHRSIESIVFNIYGNTSQHYFSLIDYGGFMGIGEAFDESSTGLTNGGSEKPYVNQENALSLQINLFNNKRRSFFNELSAKIGSGNFGQESTSTIVFSEHISNTYSYRGILTLDRGESRHQFSLRAKLYSVENTFNHYTEIDDEEKGKVVVYGIAQKVGNKTRNHIDLKYSGYFNIENNKPLYLIEAGINYNSNYLRSVYYDALTVRKQEINQLNAHTFAYRNFYRSKNSYRLMAGIAYATGTGYAIDDTYYTEGQGALITIDRYAYREFEYFTSNRIIAQLGGRYSRLINHDNNKIFGEIRYNATKAFNTQFIGDYHGNINFNIGYQF